MGWQLERPEQQTHTYKHTHTQGEESTHSTRHNSHNPPPPPPPPAVLSFYTGQTIAEGKLRSEAKEKSFHSFFFFCYLVIASFLLSGG